MIIDGSIHKSGFPIDFVPVLLKPIKNEHIMSPFELKMIALFKKNKGKKKKGKKKKTKKKGGRKSKHNIKMARKFRRTRRKRGAGNVAETDEEYKARMEKMCGSIQSDIDVARQNGASLADLQHKFQSDLDWCNANYFTDGDVKLGGKKSRRKRRRRTKKRKSRRRKKRSRRRRRKKR